jgi:hypothetical protein
MRHSASLALALGIIGAPTLVGLGPFAPSLPSSWYEAAAQSDLSYPTQANFEFRPELLDPLDEGFQAIYIDLFGNVLGTFVTVPGARLKVYANGDVEIDQRDFTTEVTYFGNGRIRTVGNARFEYFNNGRIRRLHDINFSYFTNGHPQAIGNLRFTYFSQGRLHRIGNVAVDYERNGEIRRISQPQTSQGVRIIVVN